MTSPPTQCFTCFLIQKPTSPFIVYNSDRVIVNHIFEDNQDRSGWFVVSLKVHVSRLFQLNKDDRKELNHILFILDEVLAKVFASKRNMIASLGWFTLDHLHFHVVPTVSEPVTYGYENFGDSRYVPLGGTPVNATQLVSKALRLILASNPVPVS